MTRAWTPAQRTILWTFVLMALLAVRLPSLVEPAGGDQGLYEYVGQRINAGDVTYRDAWDQKPPAIHVIYALLWRVWPGDAIAAAADLIAAGIVAGLLVLLGRRTFGTGVGAGAACVFLIFGNPAIQRLSGVRVRGQCETFIALAVTAALVIAAHPARQRWRFALAGVWLGAAFWLKYNAGVYVIPLAFVAAGTGRSADRRSNIAWIGAGFLAVAAIVVGYFAAHGALEALRLATIDYNLQYSRETYQGFSGALSYLTFPVERAAADALWFFGGAGCLLLLITSWRDRNTWLTLSWIAAACASIAVNGARDLPQYFVQAHPALALTAAAGFAPILRSDTPRLLRLAMALLILAGLWRVGSEPRVLRLGGLPGVVENMRFDLDYARGRMDRATYLARFQQQSDAKFVPRSADELETYVRRATRESDTILVFGFAGGVYAHTGRASASRFFWSRPVEVEFGVPRPGYGSPGLLADLERNRPAIVALQKHWGKGAEDPISFFMNHADLSSWLRRDYVLDEDTPEFAVWRRTP